MALSTLKQPKAVMRQLKRDYLIADEAEIRAYIERHPDVPPVLADIRHNIRRFFDEDAVRLQLSHDPEWPEEEPTLIAYVLAPRDHQDALQRLNQLDEEWWIKKTSSTRAPLVVSVMPIRRV